MRITYKTPIVEMQGDEMTRVMWDWIKEILLEPYIELNTEFYDLGLINRDLTEDAVTYSAAAAIKKYGVGVKCATITSNAQRMEEYRLKKLLPSPNATLRAELDGTVFRAPVMCKALRPALSAWTKPITIARHAYGDIYKACEAYSDTAVKAYLCLEYADGTVKKQEVMQTDGGAVFQAVHNTDKSIEAFAKACFEYALFVKQDLWFAAKDTISKTYDHRFKDIFAQIYNGQYLEKFAKAGVEYNYSLIDDSVARVMKSNGGFVWALKNYDGDVMSDMVASAFGSLAMMTSVLVSPSGAYEFEAAHGTVTRHYYQYKNGGKTSTNPVATIFAWTGALSRRAQTENNALLSDFCARLENAVKAAIENGFITKDLAAVFEGKYTLLDTREFLLKAVSYL